MSIEVIAKRSKYDNKAIVDHYFKISQKNKEILVNGVRVNKLTDIGICICGKELCKGNGYNNLMSHITSKHKDYEQKLDIHNEMVKTGMKPAISLLHFYNDKSTTYYNWLHWIIDTDQPFSFIEKDSTRSFSNLKSISRNTLTQIITKVCDSLVLKIKDELKEVTALGLIFDDWNHNKTDYVSLRASYNISLNGESYVHTPLLAFAPLLDETYYGAANHADFIISTLENYYGQKRENIVFVGGDNENTNPAIADILNVPLNGCKSHIFNLAAQQFYFPYEQIIKIANTIMLKLINRKNRALLRLEQVRAGVKELEPLDRNSTHWSSTFNMLKRFIELRPLLNNIPTVVNLLPNPHQDNLIKDLVKQLEFWNIITKNLQSNDCTNVLARSYFDSIIEKFHKFKYPFEDEEDFDAMVYLGEDAEILHNSTWNRAIYKIQSGREYCLSPAEDHSVRRFLKIDNDHQIDNDDTPETFLKKAKKRALDPYDSNDTANSGNTSLNNNSENINTSANNNRHNINERVPKQLSNSKYIPLGFVMATSNICERDFSAARVVDTYQRQSMLPKTLEQIMMLRHNRSFWDIQLVHKATEDAIIDDNAEDVIVIS